LTCAAPARREPRPTTAGPEQLLSWISPWRRPSCSARQS
jgi:hypothetical protein